MPEGRLVGDPVRLTPQQKTWIRSIYDSPTRLFILSMGRKNAKTALSAMLLLAHLCGPRVKPNSELYSVAQSRDQAAILFGLAVKMIRMNKELNDVIVVRETAKQLVCPALGIQYRALSADANTALGLSPSFVVHDELGQVRGSRSALYEAMETACAAQAEPLSLIISTQAPSPTDLLSILIDDAQTKADPTTKLILYSAPTEDEYVAQGKTPVDPFSLDAIKLANPHLEKFMNKAEVLRQAQDAKRMPSRQAAYRNLILNQRVEVNNAFISRVVWEENGAEPRPLQRGDKAYAGLDLSSTTDLTALVLIRQAGELWDVFPTFWLPGDGLAEKSRTDRVHYDLWADQGLIETTPGGSIEYEFIAAHLRDVFDRYQVAALAFDRYNMKFLKPWLLKVGFSEEELLRFVEFGQGYVSMSPAIRELESLLLARKLRHGGHPVLTMCAANATIAQDPAENRKFVKQRESGRIDGIVALAMALGVVSQAPADEERTPILAFF